MPLIIVSAVRFGPFGASLSLLVTALLAIGSALSGRSPLTDLPAEQRVMALQVFLIVVGVPLLFVSALMKERAQIADTLRQRLSFEELLSQLSGAFVHLPSTRCTSSSRPRSSGSRGSSSSTRAGSGCSRARAEAFEPVAWHGPSASRAPSRVGRESFGWCAERILSQLPDRQLGRRDAADAGPTERERLRRMGMRSLLALPLVAGGEVIGAWRSSRPRRTAAGRSRWWRTAGWSPTSWPGARAHARRGRAARQREHEVGRAASLTSLVAVLDRDGRIIAVNESWTRFGRLHSPVASVVGPGESYIDVCRRAAETATSSRARRSSASRACSSAAFRASPGLRLPRPGRASAGST
jgi:PAS domain-containing protein